MRESPCAKSCAGVVLVVDVSSLVVVVVVVVDGAVGDAMWVW